MSGSGLRAPLQRRSLHPTCPLLPTDKTDTLSGPALVEVVGTEGAVWSQGQGREAPGEA